MDDIGRSSGVKTAGMHEARWCTHENGESVNLQIELGNDCAVTLVCWKDGAAPSVALWQGTGEHNFNDAIGGRGEKSDSFRRWIAEALPRT